MAKARQLIRRRKSVQNIRTITKTMEMIAASRFQRSHRRVAQMRHAVSKVERVANEMAALTGWEGHPLLRAGTSKVWAMLVVTADRGMAGGYNNRLIVAARQEAARLLEQGREVALFMMGKKGISYLRYQPTTVPPGQAMLPRPEATYPGVDDRTVDKEAREISGKIMAAFMAGKCAGFTIVYNKMQSGASYGPEAIQLLPLPKPSGQTEAAGAQATAAAENQAAMFDFIPSPAGVLAAALPMVVRLRLNQYLLESAVSEQLARMTAMSAATKAGDDTTTLLTRRINRARQSQITTELSEIISGADALK